MDEAILSKMCQPILQLDFIYDIKFKLGANVNSFQFKIHIDLELNFF